MENKLEMSAVLEKMVKEEKMMKPNGHEVSVLLEINKGGAMRHVKQEDDSSKPSSPNRKEIACIKEMPLVTITERSSMETNSKDSSSIQKNQEDQLKLAKAEMDEVREENERLKLLFARILKDYQSLQMNFFDILQQEAKKSKDTNKEPELVSLSLGRTSSDHQPRKDEKKKRNFSDIKEAEKLNEGLALALGLDCRFEPASTEPMKNPNSENSSDQEQKKEEPTETWPPSKILKTVRSGDDEVLQQNHLKKPRVSVRARCDTPTMTDGCQWRKYGQKIAKGNPCPRAYYRCTVSTSCPVRKQVQRCVEDMSVLITTYEGTHNHPLSISATAMASTTSAAASMLESRSSSSQLGIGTSVSAPISTSTTTSLHGLNFNLSQNSRPQQFYFPNSSISTSNSHPTITLDLTAPNTSSHFNRLSSRFPSAPRYSSTCLNFSASSSSSLEPNTLQTSWGNSYLSYGTTMSNKTHIGSLNLGRQPPQENYYQPYMQMNNQTPSQQSLTDTIAAATKAITSNPTFRSALAAALTSFAGNGGSGAPLENQGVVESSGLNLK